MVSAPVDAFVEARTISSDSCSGVERGCEKYGRADGKLVVVDELQEGKRLY